MLHRTNRPHRPAVRAVPLVQTPPSSGGLPPAPTRPRLVPPLGPETDATGTETPLVQAAPSVASAPAGAVVPAGPGADLTDAERVIVEDLFHRASQLRQVCLALLAVALLVLLVVLMR